jgi:EpsD family peptidyl-prolyl cis-trans isomerase
MGKPYGVVPAAALAVSIAFIAGCGEGGEKKVASQVAVRVNSGEITVHQLNAALSKASHAPPESATRAKRQALESLIERELARQQAVLAKLDRSPEVVQALEAARTEILARAYLQHVASLHATAPTEEEVKRYYAEHSELFSERRLYALDEISFADGGGLAAELAPRLPKAQSLEDVANFLKQRQVAYTAHRIGRPAEDLPLVTLERLKGMKDGEIRLIDAGAGRVSIVRLVASRHAPVDEAAAAPRIERFIANQRAGQSAAEELKRLRTQAKIEYFGEFSGAPAQAQPVTAAPPDAALTNAEAVRALR